MKKHQFYILFTESVRTEIKKHLQENNQSRYQKFLVQLKISNYFKNIAEEDKSPEFGLKNIDRKRNYFVEDIEQAELISNKHKKVCITLK